jgi:hypothetical protein
MQSENHYTETDLGNVAPNPRGNFDSTAKYEYLDLVAMQGGSYLCLAELGQTITGTAPEPGKTTELWQCLAMPGDRTPEYTDAHDKVVRLAKEVAQDAAKVAEDKQSVAQMETNARQLKKQAEESARQAENSKDSAAGSAREAKKAEESARQAENNVRTQVNGFDAHVEEKTTEATQAVATAKDNAVQAVERQETASVQEVKDQTATYITEQKNLAKQELDDKVNRFGLDVNVIKAEVSKEGQKQITNVQEATTTELTKIAEKGTEQTGLVTAEGNKQVKAVQTAAQEIIADREQIQKNKADIASLTQNKADAIINTATGEHIAVGDSSGHLLDNLRIFGKSEQVQTTGKNLFSVVFNHTIDTGIFRYDMKLKPNTNYTLSCDVPKTTVASLYLNGERTDINGVFKNGPKTIMTDETGNIYILVRNADYTNSINLYQAVLDGLHYIQLEEGENATYPEPYTGGKPSPSPDWQQEIINAGDKGKIGFQITTSNFSSVNIIERKQSVTSEAIRWSGKNNVYIKGKFKTYDDESYVLFNVTYYDEDMEYMGSNGYSRKIGRAYEIEQTSFDGASANNGENVDLTKVSYMSFCFRGDNKESSSYKEFSGFDIMVSDKPLDVENYFVPWNGLQDISLDLNLTKWDKLEKREGIWGIARKSKAVDLSEKDWIEYKNTVYPGGIHCYLSFFENSMFKYNSSLCTHFKNVSNAWDNETAKIGIYSDHISVRNKYFISDKPTPEEFKTWLLQQKEAGTPVEVVYETETETWEPLPEETQKTLNALHTNYPTTVVTNNAGAGMELSYVADTKNYTDNKIKEAVSAQTQSLANLLSLMPLSTQAAMIETDTNNILDNMEVTEYE